MTAAVFSWALFMFKTKKIYGYEYNCKLYTTRLKSVLNTTDTHNHTNVVHGTGVTGENGDDDNCGVCTRGIKAGLQHL